MVEHVDSMAQLSSALVRLLPRFIGLAIFSTTAFIAFTLFIYTDLAFLRLFFMAMLMTVTLVRLVLLLSDLIFAPSSSPFRILPLHDDTARTLHKLLSWTATYLIFSIMFAVVTYKLGGQLLTMQLILLTSASLLLFVTAGGIIMGRHQIRNQILMAAANEPSWARQQFAELWHIFALAYLFIIWLMIVYLDNGQGREVSKGAFFISFFVVPIWLVMNTIGQWIIAVALKTLQIYTPDPAAELTVQEQQKNENGKRFYHTCKRLGSVVLLCVLTIWVASLWGLSVPFISRFTGVFFDTTIIVAVALLLWQFISSWIERKINESLPEAAEDDSQDDEWGASAARGRSYTLLPMIRKSIGTVLVVMVTLTILSSMGVNIGPLLAGAGVVGLAVGFGAQKLVADMFSGFFYLFDDAFRVGEYLEAGSVSGVVESITLRNVMLRHHRGMLLIVPHSELGPITNFMRGGIVVKFNLDFPYDADIDKIRKIIKKVGQAMLNDEEFGKDFIKPVKSQGVREITNSVMTIRVKFTAQPGTHFVIRREAFKRITEALNDKGIHYAHKKVIVDLPPATTEQMSPAQVKAAGAAAMRAIDEEAVTEQKNSSDESEAMG